MKTAAPRRSERRPARVGRERGTGGEAVLFSFLCLAVGALAAAKPALVMLPVFGLLPTVAAWIAAMPDQAQRTRCIAFANLAGVIPVAAHLLNVGGTLRSLADPVPWAIIYGAAAVGWLLNAAVPAAAEALLRRRLDTEVRMLERQQAALIQEWGTELHAGEPEA